jgi:predicted cobalt transporter CbtA
VIVLAALGGCRAREQVPAPAVAAAVKELDPWQPVDEGFRGCEGG